MWSLARSVFCITSVIVSLNCSCEQGGEVEYRTMKQQGAGADSTAHPESHASEVKNPSGNSTMSNVSGNVSGAKPGNETQMACPQSGTVTPPEKAGTTKTPEGEHTGAGHLLSEGHENDENAEARNCPDQSSMTVQKK